MGYAVVTLVNPKSAENIGGVFRAAFIYSASLIILVGARVDNRKRKWKADTPNGWRSVPVIQAEDAFSIMPVGSVPVAVEIVPEARPLPHFPHPDQAVYLFGPEDGSLEPGILQQCQHVVKIPTKYCMNLAAAVNVVLYDRLAKELSRP